MPIPLPAARLAPPNLPPQVDHRTLPRGGTNARIDDVFDAAKHGGLRGLKWGAISGAAVGAAIGVALLVTGGPAGLLVGGATAGALALKYGLIATVAGGALGAGVALLEHGR